jgi:uncharacterized protein (TIGR02118 family)
LAAVTGNVAKVIATVHVERDLAIPSLRPPVGAASCYVPFGEGVSGREDPVSAVVTLHLDGSADARALDLASVLGVAPLEAYLVEERRQWDDFPAPVVTRVSFVRRAPELTRSAFAEHWTSNHAPLARVHHPGVCRYVQNVVVDALTPAAPDVDGIAELSFRSESDREERMYDSPEGQAIIRADVRRFIDLTGGWRILAREVRLQGVT